MHFELVSRMAEEEAFKWGSAAPFIAIIYDELRRRKMCTLCRRGEVKHSKTLEKYSMATDEQVLKNAKTKMSGMQGWHLLEHIKRFECLPWRTLQHSKQQLWSNSAEGRLRLHRQQELPRTA